MNTIVLFLSRTGDRYVLIYKNSDSEMAQARTTRRKEGLRLQTTQIADHNIQAYVQTTGTGADRPDVLPFRRRDCNTATTTDGGRNSRHLLLHTSVLLRGNIGGSSGFFRVRLQQLRHKRIRPRHRCQMV